MDAAGVQCPSCEDGAEDALGWSAAYVANLHSGGWSWVISGDLG